MVLLWPVCGSPAEVEWVWHSGKGARPSQQIVVLPIQPTSMKVGFTSLTLVLNLQLHSWKHFNEVISHPLVLPVELEMDGPKVHWASTEYCDQFQPGVWALFKCLSCYCDLSAVSFGTMVCLQWLLVGVVFSCHLGTGWGGQVLLFKPYMYWYLLDKWLDASFVFLPDLFCTLFNCFLAL